MTPDPSQLLTRAEVAALCAMSVGAFRWYEKTDRGPARVSIAPKVHRYRRRDVDAWIASMVEEVR